MGLISRVSSRTYRKNPISSNLTSLRQTIMGNQQGNLNRKKNTEKKKYQAPLPTTIGKKKNKRQTPDQISKIPAILPPPHSQCKLRLLKQNRIKDYLLLEQEFITNQERLKPHDEQDKEEREKVEEIRGRPMVVGNLEEVIDDNHAIVSTSIKDVRKRRERKKK